MRILAIDPGNEMSAWMIYGDTDRRPVAFGKHENGTVLELCRTSGIRGVIQPSIIDHFVIEMVASYGMAVGREVFETVYWIGRFCEAFRGRFHRLYRKDVKMHLCGNNAAKDANIRQSLIDLYGPGKDKAIGRKAAPGPLFGISNDVWSALAVARTFADVKLPRLAAVG